VGYLRQFLIFRPRNFDGQSRARCPEAITHHLDENPPEALTYDIPPNAPISALTTPYSAARSPLLRWMRARYCTADSHKTQVKINKKLARALGT
jgi:hypothetical protein